jgi:hypothetical protein
MVRASCFDVKKMSVLALFGTATAFGCMVDDSGDSPASGGTAGTGGTAAGAGGSGAGTGGSAGMAATCMPNPTALTCAGTTVPTWGMPPGMTVGKLIDFATYATNGTGTWGSSVMGELTGGTSLYHGPDDVNLTAAADAGALKLTGTISPMGYVGIVFWFGPCINASAFTGLAFSVGGTSGGAVMKAQIQTHVDYPVDVANSKGGCSFTDCDAKFSECAGPTYQLVVPETPGALELPWSSFAGGTPVAEVTPDGLVGLQYQLECQSDTACVFDITLGSISLTIAPTAN